MHFFGFDSRKVNACFNLKYLKLLVMLISCTWAQENIPSFNVTCNSTGLYVKIAFSKPFIGIAFAKGHRFDPLCSMFQSSVFDGYLTLPLTACGTYVQEINHPWITNTIIFQQHPLVWTTDDFEKSIICSLPHPYENFRNSSFLLDQIYELHSLPSSKSASDIELGLDIFREDGGKIFDYTYTRLTIFQLLHGTVYNDVGVKSCVAHDEDILDADAKFHQITNPQGCFTVNSENSSSLIIHYTEAGIWADVKIQTLEMDSSNHIYLTCEIFLCRTKCSCSNIDQQTEYPTTIISHKVTKRSTDASSEMVSLKQYEARTRYLKSTVKALMDSIVEQRKKNDQKSIIGKRVMRLDDSSFPSETESLASHGIASTEIFSPGPVSTNFKNRQPHYIEINDDPEHLPDIYDDSDPHLADIYDDSDFDYHLRDAYDDSDSDDSHHEHREAIFHTAEISTVDSNTAVVTLLKEFKDNGPKIIPDVELHGKVSTAEISTVDSNTAVVTSPKEFKDNGTKIVPDVELQGKVMTVVNDDVLSSLNDATENVKNSTTAISVFPPLAGDNDHLGNCVPRLRFVIVIVVLGFSIGFLLLVSCGMVLYIRKEKKRNKLNDFLLYSIGF